ncbi:unnamed protein product [Caenorhabditis sp. 36 PRJEB53466]|nr:unnamed protein product [Caenorhabditis sp. 36 PRJEB53466]
MISSTSFAFRLVLLILSVHNCWPTPSHQPRRPNTYKWLAQNSYLCDPSLLNRRSHRFLAPREATRLRCSCGDPLVTKSACARRKSSEKPRCFRLPEACIQEYTVIFANGGNRLSKPPKLARRRPTVSITAKRRPTVIQRRPHRKPKIVSKQWVNTVLRVKKPTKPGKS